MHLTVLLAAALLGPDPVAPPPVTAFLDVTVIPMTGPTDRLEHQTVVIRDGRIAVIGPAATTPIPEGAIRIDGRGKFLIPGLSDMHTAVRPAAGRR